MKKILIVLAVTLILAGCTDLFTTIELGGDGGDPEPVYIINYTSTVQLTPTNLDFNADKSSYDITTKKGTLAYTTPITSVGRSKICAEDNTLRQGVLTVELPDTVTTLLSNAFGAGDDYNLSNITAITVHATTPPSVSGFGLPTQNITVYVPAASVEAYKAADEWKNKNILAIP